MAQTSYYGLKSSSGSLVKCGWTSLPVLTAYYIESNDIWQNYHNFGYALSYAGSYYRTYDIRNTTPVNRSYINRTSTFSGHSFQQGGSRTWSKLNSSSAGGMSLGVSLTMASSLGMTLYLGTEAYTLVKYYAFNISVASNSVNSAQVGNIAIYRNGVLEYGSIDKDEFGVSSFPGTIWDTNPTTQITLVATACTSAIQKWHDKYFFNGVYKDSFAIPDSDIVFTSDVATYNVTLDSDSTTFVFDYGQKFALTINSLPSGVQSTKVSYTRTHSTGNYVTTTTSPISLSGAGTLYVESARSVKFEAKAKSGNVFSTSNGFISQTSGVSSIYGNNSDSITANAGIPAMLKACSFSLTATSYTISVSIPDATQKGWGSVYIDQSGTTSKTLVLDQQYSIHFVSSRDNQEAPTVAGWYVDGVLKSTAASYTYTASSLSGNVSVTCVLAQNAWPVTVHAQSNGSASIAGRYMKSTGATLTPGYLFADGRDYMKVNVTPNDHYDEDANSRVVSNLSAYSAGGAYAYSLASEASGALTFYFVLAECVIRTQIGNSGLPVADANICTTSPESTTRRYDAGESVFCNVYCNIKDEYVGIYRCDYWLIGGVQREAEPGGTGQYYFTLSPSDWQNRSELVCIPHLVSTSNQLTVTKSGDQAFATVYVKPSASEPEESMSGSSYSKSVRENSSVIARIVAKFGGQIGNITYTGIENPDVTESQISFTMPSNDCSVNFAISEKDKVTLALCVANTTDPVVAVGKITLTAPGSSDVREEVNTLQPQSRNIYKNTTYTLTATDDDLTYMFSGWYKNDSEYVSSNLSINISCSSSEKYTAVYVMRQSGTITVNYGIKSGDDVTPTDLPEESSPFGLVIDTEPDQTNPDKWVIGNSRYIDFHVLDNGISYEWVEREGQEGYYGTFVWTPVRVEVKANVQSEGYSTVWTYDELNPDSRSGRFIMRDNMLVRLVFNKVEAEGYSRVRAIFMGGMNAEMGELSIFSTKMESYYSLGGEAEAVCLVGKKVVLAAAPKPGYSFAGWFKVVDDEFEPVESNGAVLTVDAVPSAGCTYFADFARSSSGVKAWNDDENPKVFEWRSKVYVGAQFFALRNLRIYSDVYPVTITLMTATSPNGCFTPSARTLTMQITSQSPRLIPVMRLEKYFAFKVNGTGRINHIAIASGMEAMK